jgi:hypothetical protein
MLFVCLQYLSATFSGTSGRITGLTNLEKSISIQLDQTLLYYKSFNGQQWPPSGAYIFRSNGTDAYPVSGGQQVQISVVQVHFYWKFTSN